jgi:hypothetical protein
MQLHLVAESSTICSSRSRRPVRKLLDTPSYLYTAPIYIRVIQSTTRSTYVGDVNHTQSKSFKGSDHLADLDTSNTITSQKMLQKEESEDAPCRGDKVRLRLCLNKHHAMKTYSGGGGIAPHILNLGATWRWSASHPGRLAPGEIAPGTHCIRGSVDLRAGLDAVAKTGIISHCRESNPCHPGRSLVAILS